MVRTRWHVLPPIAGLLAASTIALLVPVPLHSQAQTTSPAGARPASSPAPALKGTLERLKVHGKALEGNLMGESAEPEVSIYLPPSYGADRSRRYPVVYLLHGYTGTDLGYFGPTGRQLHRHRRARVRQRRRQRDDSRHAELHERLRRLHVPRTR